MLEVHSPVPLQEGESLMFGISTKHLMNGAIGLGVSSPFLLIALLILPLFHQPRWIVGFVALGVAALFAVVKVKKDRALAEVLFLSIRFTMRPKWIVYDRAYRVKTHRQKGDGTL